MPADAVDVGSALGVSVSVGLGVAVASSVAVAAKVGVAVAVAVADGVIVAVGVSVGVGVGVLVGSKMLTVTRFSNTVGPASGLNGLSGPKMSTRMVTKPDAWVVAVSQLAKTPFSTGTGFRS